MVITLFGCVLLRTLPEPTKIDERLAVFPTSNVPVRDNVNIYWNEYSIPFIEAKHDDDLAFALGMVNAHLRLGQMSVLRLVTQGRISEMAGPFTRDIDHALRIIDFGYAAASIEESLPEHSRRWLKEFVRGINFYQEKLIVIPHDMEVMGISLEPWRVRDVITLGRLSAIDLHWLAWLKLLPLNPQDANAMLRLMTNVNAGRESPNYTDTTTSTIHYQLHQLLALGVGHGRSGSNVMTVAGQKTVSGAAIIASDPHVGVQLPPLWLIVGLKSPSYHAVGITLPGLPVLIFGRNHDIAWGATNMRSLNSDLYALSPDEVNASNVIPTTISSRWWFDTSRIVRRSRLGPVISDIPFIADAFDNPVALRWQGHDTSDEISPFLDVMRAHNWNEFRAAFTPYALPGSNIIYADRRGNIGQLMAVTLPKRQWTKPESLIHPTDSPEFQWLGLLKPNDLPTAYNPPAGFLSSSNNKPFNDAGTIIGYAFPPQDRHRRISGLLAAQKTVDVKALQAIQCDVYSLSDHHLNQLLVERARKCGATKTIVDKHPEFQRQWSNWDGYYHSQSRGAVAFQALVAAFAEPALTTLFDSQELRNAIIASPELLIQTLIQALPDIPDEKFMPILVHSADEAVVATGGVEKWGDIQVLKINHFLANTPYIGGRYRFASFPYYGANSTIQKSARGGITPARQTVRYGANARHISDLCDPDKNYFILLGGQDGYINSAGFMDQVPLWLDNQYINVPLTIENVRRNFTKLIILHK